MYKNNPNNKAEENQDKETSEMDITTKEAIAISKLPKARVTSDGSIEVSKTPEMKTSIGSVIDANKEQKTDKADKTQYGAEKSAIYEIITDLMKPYCQAKVGGAIYECPTDIYRPNNPVGKVIHKGESSKDRVYSKEVLKYQTPDEKYICFKLEDYQENLKKNDQRELIQDIQKALEKEGIDPSYILDKNTQKMYLLEAPGISQWMRAEDTKSFDYKIDRLGNRTEKTADEKKTEAKNNIQNQVEQQVKVDAKQEANKQQKSNTQQKANEEQEKKDDEELEEGVTRVEDVQKFYKVNENKKTEVTTGSAIKTAVEEAQFTSGSAIKGEER